jgi:type II secretory pathway pseudopilin PulG
LLVVIAIIAILAALLLPALAKAKTKAQQIGCLNNYRQLQFCWQMYIDDQQDNLPPNGAMRYIASRTDITTEANAWLLGNAYTDTTFTNLQNGVLFRYNQSVGIYKCPGDNSTVLDLGKAPRTRSVSMSIYMNAVAEPGGSYFRNCWHKSSQITQPSPTRAFVFIDEHQNSIQQSCFAANAPGFQLFGAPQIIGSASRPRGTTTVARSPSPTAMPRPGAGGKARRRRSAGCPAGWRGRRTSLQVSMTVIWGGCSRPYRRTSRSFDPPNRLS